MKTAVRQIFVLSLLIAVASCDLFDEINTSDASLELYGQNPREIYDGTANSCDGNEDESLSQGESVRIQLRLNNSGEEDAEGVTLNISSNDNYVSVVQGHSQTLGDMPINHYAETADANSSSSILIHAEEGTPNGHIAEFEVVIRDRKKNKWTERFTIVVEPVAASVVLYGENPRNIYDATANGADGNGNRELNAGETIRVQLRIHNEGEANVMQVRMTASTDDEFVKVVDDSTYTFGDMIPYRIHETPDAQSNSALLLSADATTPAGHTATINLTFTDKFNNLWTDSFTIVVR